MTVAHRFREGWDLRTEEGRAGGGRMSRGRDGVAVGGRRGVGGRARVGREALEGVGGHGGGEAPERGAGLGDDGQAKRGEGCVQNTCMFEAVF